MQEIQLQRILILNFGSQYVQLIARRVREIGVYCEVHPSNVSAAFIRKFAPSGIILSGGPETVTSRTSPRAPEIIFTLGCPILGICYGMQTMTAQLGGEVTTSVKREYGQTSAKIDTRSKIFKDTEDHIKNSEVFLDVWMSHGDKVTKLPKGFHSIASTENTPLAAMEDSKRNFYGFQFHPEVTHTHQGQRILAHFVLDICHCEPLWTISNIVENSLHLIRAKVGAEKVLLGLSGGVDSSVAAILLHKAIGDQLTCMFIDTGLLRFKENQQIATMFAKHFGMKIIRVNARKQFLSALKGVTNPERKRKIIGKKFIDVFTKEGAKLCNTKWLAQGTIYPDVIESAKTELGNAHVIKTHHNVGGLPQKMHWKLIEPLRELFKDEVRKIGVELGLPSDLIDRHPFPGPGLAVRVIGEIKTKYLDLLRSADHIFIEELHKEKLYSKVSQAFAVFLPVKSVGVMGDARKYEYVIALRAVETTDFMTADWARLPQEFLAKVSARIVNEVKGVSRVVYDISSKPPATIEWE